MPGSIGLRSLLLTGRIDSASTALIVLPLLMERYLRSSFAFVLGFDLYYRSPFAFILGFDYKKEMWTPPLVRQRHLAIHS